MKTNIGLVKYAEKALNEKWGYVWGTFGQVLTERLFQDKLRQYPSGVGNYRSFIRSNWLGRRTADCVGLIKSYMWYNEITHQINYNPSTDVNADMMYARARKKGSIKDIPETPGLCVWRKGHIGVYVGNGYVIEAQGTVHGVKKHKLSNRNFTHWLECPYIDYIKDTPKKEVEKVTKVNSNIPDAWAKKYWEWATKKGFFDGKRPKDNITRQEMAVVLNRLVNDNEIQ